MYREKILVMDKLLNLKKAGENHGEKTIHPSKRKVYLKNNNNFFFKVPHVVAILRCNIAHPPLTLHCVCSPTELCRWLDL